MSFKILYVAATSSESVFLEEIIGLKHANGHLSFKNINLSLLISGIGSVATSWAMMKWIAENGIPDLAINCGIAGSYKDDVKIGDVVMPVSDCFADSGIEDGEKYISIFEAGLIIPDEFPFIDGNILAENRYTVQMKDVLKPVKAITVNTATGSETSRNRLLSKFNPDIETMEGAAFFYICKREQIPFLALRSISNRVEQRNKSNWNIPLALKNLSEKVNEILLMLD